MTQPEVPYGPATTIRLQKPIHRLVGEATHQLGVSRNAAIGLLLREGLRALNAKGLIRVQVDDDEPPAM